VSLLLYVHSIYHSGTGHKWLAGMTAKGSGLILDKDSIQSHDALDAMPLTEVDLECKRHLIPVHSLQIMLLGVRYNYIS
jgi:uncharacterized protein